MMDWLTWPADLLLSAGRVVAGLFMSEDAPNFVVVQMMVATLLLGAVVSLLVFWQSVTDFLRRRWRALGMRRPS
jgi:NADH:ubiquinone oxidoreductase subunit 6 (subunit J)